MVACNSNAARTAPGFNTLYKYGIAFFGLLLLAASAAIAAAPPAGTVIGNQAVATYENGAGQTVTVNSNAVQTIVQEVPAVSMTSNNQKFAAPGGKVFLPHVITNDGNGDDSFTLATTATNAQFTFDSILIYPDADLDGVPDSLTPIAVTPALSPGASFGIVIEAVVPSTATATPPPAEDEDITVTATSTSSGAVSASNTDTVTITSDAIIELSKSMVVTNDLGGNGVGVGDTVTITLTYSNTGISDASNVVLSDVLPSTLIYDDNSASWSDNASAWTDGTALVNGSGDQVTLNDPAAGGGATVTATFDNIPAGKSGTVSFTTTIAGSVLPGSIDNTASSSINGATAVPSNTATIEVLPTYNVTIADTGAAPDDDAANDVALETGPVSEGAEIPFEFVVTNTGNFADRFNISVAPGTFPLGTTFSIVGSDGITPLLDSNGDGVPDIGPLAAGATGTIRVIADLPTGFTGALTYSATVTATSIGNSAQSDPSTLTFNGTINGAAVDIVNISAFGGGLTGGDGAVVDNAGNPWTTLTTDPGGTVSFFLRVDNEGSTPDTFLLQSSTSNFVAGTVPSGWTVKFYNSSGAEVSNTGVLAAGTGTFEVEARVTVPATATPVTAQSIFFRAISATNSTVFDVKEDAVTVNTITDLAITADTSAQAAPGGVVVIPHLITNNGNVNVTEGAITFTSDETTPTHSVTIYHDVNNDGALDAGDVVIDNVNDIGTIAPGAAARILVRVQVPSTAVPGTSESGTVQVGTGGSFALNSGVNDSVGTNNRVSDLITIVSGDMVLVKEQALDAACTNAPGAYVQSQLAANPGQCIRYRITATNTGTVDAGNVTITDSTPTFTTHHECTAACPASRTPAGAVTAPGNGNIGSVSASYGTVVPSGVVTLEFTVRIDN